MGSISNKNISIAVPADTEAIKNLLNMAYRGESSKQGWTTEAALIAGDTRTDEDSVLALILQPKTVFLVYRNEQQIITGCVNLQEIAGKIYLGMFSVLPALQGAGIGKQILKAAEEYASAVHCAAIYMTVISARLELIGWYKRHGYIDTGERKPFIEDDLTGKHLQPLEFMVMEKSLNT